MTKLREGRARWAALWLAALVAPLACGAQAAPSAGETGGDGAGGSDRTGGTGGVGGSTGGSGGLGGVDAATGGSGGTGGDGSSVEQVTGIVEIFSFLLDGGDAQGLKAVVDLFTAVHPGIRIVDTAQGQADVALALLETRLNAGNPPDSFQALAGRDLLRWVTRGTTSDAQSIMEPLDSLAGDQAWASAFSTGVLGSLAFNGHLYGVPVDIERDNTLYYSKKAFADAQITDPPRTLDEFYAAGDKLKAKGYIPLAIGSAESWPLGMIAWYDVMVAVAGPQYYEAFFRGRQSPGDPQVRATLEAFKKVLSYSNYDPMLRVDANPPELLWDQAVDLVYGGKAAMTIMGDWTKQYLGQKAPAWTPDVDFGEAAAPGTSGTFVFASNAFGLPRGAINRSGAIELLKTFGSAQAQVALNAPRRELPANRNADVSELDAMSRKRFADMTAASAVAVPILEILLPADAVNTVEDSLLTFAEDGDVDTEIQALQAVYPAFQQH